MRLLNEEQKKWVEIIGEFAKKEIEPIMLDWDKVVDPSKAIPFDAYAKAFELGLNSFEIPKEYGGNKVTLDVAEVMYEEMGYYDGNFASVMQTTNARCPNCFKKMELRGEGDNQMFACVCGYREKLSAFKE